jgi:CheY-like chemotaxis protein
MSSHDDEHTPPRGRVRTPFNPDLNAKPVPSGNEALDHIRKRLDDVFDPDVGAFADIRKSLEALHDKQAEQRRATLTQASFLHAMIADDELDQVKEVEGDQKNARVLIVEDERLLRRVLCRVVKLAGMHALSASDATEAEAILRAHPIDVAIIDINLPGGRNGLDLARVIRDLYRDIGCLIVTGMLSQEEAVVAKALDVRVLEKPLHNDDLLTAIREVYVARASQRPEPSGD